MIINLFENLESYDNMQADGLNAPEKWNYDSDIKILRSEFDELGWKSDVDNNRIDY